MFPKAFFWTQGLGIIRRSLIWHFKLFFQFFFHQANVDFAATNNEEIIYVNNHKKRLFQVLQLVQIFVLGTFVQSLIC